MTPEEIRKQMMGSAGVKEEDAESLYAKADSSFSNKVEIEAEIQGKPLAKASASEPQEPASVNAKPPWEKSVVLALVLAFFFGPFGLFYVSWKRALAMLLLFIIGVSLIPNNEFVVLLLWMVVPILSIILLGVGKRQPPPA